MKDTEIQTMTRNHLSRTVTVQQLQQQQQTTAQQQVSTLHQQTKWSIKERLFLVACVLINGESNWSFISDQLNKWMKYTSNYINIPLSTNISILGANSYNLPTITLRTNNQCSKQFKFIAKNYAIKHGINDLKKIYNHLAEERLKELKNLVLNSRQQFTDIYNEIEKILEMDSTNFEQLTEIWQNLKSIESNYSNRSSYGTRSSNEAANNKQQADEELVLMEKNLEAIHLFKKKKREEQEEAERLKKVAEQAAIAATAAALEEAKRIELEQEKQKKILENELLIQQQQQIELLEQQENMVTETANATTNLDNIKIEQNNSITNEDLPLNEMISPKKETDPMPTENITEEKFSSEDEAPLIKLNKKKKKQQQESTTDLKETGIEWKPTIDKNVEENNNENQSVSLTDNENDSDSELVVKKPSKTFLSPRKPLKVIETSSSSSSSSSSSENETKSEVIEQKIDSPKPKETPLAVTTTSAAAPTTIVQQLPSRKSLRNRNSLSTSSSTTITTTITKETNKPEESELIFTPLIKYDKKSTNDEESTKLTTTDETNETTTTTIIQSDKESDSGGTLLIENSKAKRKYNKIKATKKSESELDLLEVKTETESNLINSEDNDEEQEQDQPQPTATITRVSSLRSKQKQLNTSSGSIMSQNQQQSKKRNSLQTQKLNNNKNTGLIVSVASQQQQKPTTPGSIRLSSPKLQNDEIISNPEIINNKDGLLSIKCEPIQITNTDLDINTKTTSGAADLDATNSIATTELVVTTRSSRNNKDSLSNQAPFSSSSTSSILSNNSSNSYMNKFEDEKAYRAWKKSILMVLNNICCHKHATVFMHPVRDDIAPGYSSVVYRPIDLSTMKKNIESGQIKSTKEFQRDIMLMFTNAIMYNSFGHDVHKISVEMYKEVLVDVEQLLNAQEAMGEEQKPSRFKEKRSSTASDRGNIQAIELDRVESNESNEPVVNILMTNKKEAFISKDEALETGSLNSCSSISNQPALSISNVTISKQTHKFDSSNLSCSTSVSTTTSTTSTTNTNNNNNNKKRRPSSESTTHRETTSSSLNKDSQPKSKKRRKSGR